MKEKNKAYTASDFARYHAGTMPAAEMHALEKEALDDPFLADALEGYRLAPAAEAGIEELHERIAAKIKKKNKLVPFFTTANGWWRIAALLILIAGSAYLFYQVNNNKTENILAIHEKKSSKEKIENKNVADSISKNDITYSTQPSADMEPKEKISSTLSKPKAADQITAIRQSAPAMFHDSALKSSGETYQDNAYNHNAEKEADSSAKKTFLLKGKVTNQAGNAISSVTIKNENSKTVTLTDTAGRFTLSSPDSNITAIATAPGYASKNFTLEKDKQSTIEINKNEAELSEVVVTGMNIQRKATPAKGLLKKSKDEFAVSKAKHAGAYPSGGQEKFSEYIKENTTYMYDENGDHVKGEVNLSFSLNRKGMPENIKIITSSCKECETKAIYLLENGPLWIGKKNEKATVIITF